jgi:ABC-type uncharacterized transport system permease subunit
MILTSGLFLWVTALLALVAYGWMGWASLRRTASVGAWLLPVAWGLHALALATGFALGQGRFGFAPALSMTAWLTLSVYLVESRFFPGLRTHWAWAAVGGLAVMMAAWWPGHAHLHAGNGWLAAHWVLGLSAYGLFVAAAIHAWLLMRSERNLRSPGLHDSSAAPASLPVLTLERLMFQFVLAGFVLLTATLLAGAIYGGGLHAWWRDHKVAFSVLAWLVIAVLLAGRWWLGWRGRKAARFIYTATVLLLLAYAGSRFVMEVVLGR